MWSGWKTILAFVLALGFAMPAFGAKTRGPPLSDRQEQWLIAHPVITVGIHREGWLPFEGVQDGQPIGLAYETLREAAGLLGLEVRVRLYDDWQAMYDDACTGRIDLLLSLAMTAERTRCLVFTRPYIEAPVALIGRDGNDAIAISADLVGMRVVTEQHFATQGAAHERFPRARHISTDTTLSALRQIAEGRADAYLGNSYVAAALIEREKVAGVALIRPTDMPLDTLHFAVPTSHALLAEALDIALASISEAQVRALRARWMPTLRWQSAGLQLSESERASLSRRLRVGVPDDLRPIGFSDTHSGPTGLVMDYLHRFQQMGALLELGSDGWRAVLAEAENGNLDAVVGVLPDAAWSKGWVQSEPLLIVPNVIVTRARGDSVIDAGDLKGRRIAVSDPSRLGPRLLSVAPRARLIQVADATSGLEAVSKAEADAYVGNLAVVDDIVRDRYAGVLLISAPAGIDDRVVFAARPEHRDIVDAFDRMVRSMAPREREAIRGDWLSVEYRSGVQWRRVLTWVVPIGLVLITAVTMFAVGNLRLRREMKRRRKVEGQLQEVAANLPAVMYQASRQSDGTVRFPFIAGDMEALFGISSETAMLANDSLLSRVHPDDRARLSKAREWTMAHGAPLDVEFRALNADGWRWIRSCSKPQKESGLWTGYWIDITHAHEQAEELALAKVNAERLAAAKAEFLATMSHEIRTPMSGVLGMLEVLAHSGLDAEQRRVLSAIDDSAQMLRQMLDDILDLSKIEAGALTLAPGQVDVRLLIANVCELLRPQAKAKGLDLTLRVDCAIAPLHRVDGLRLRQVLFNLLSNAIKFTNEGSVSLDVERLDTPCTEERLAFTVADTGIGITTEQQARLFQPFSQANAGIARQFGGTGLGLVICRRLVDLMGGRLDMTSAPRQGTRVRVELTLEGLHKPLDDAASRKPGGATREWDCRRVLVAEDHPANQVVMRWRLQQMGLSGEIVEDGAAAWARLQEEPFDLLITDCFMPVLDGYALTRMVRDWERETGRPRMAIIGLSANAAVEDEQRCRYVGMDDFIAKPVPLAVLRRTLERWLPHAADGGSSIVDDLVAPLSRRYGSRSVALDVAGKLARAIDEDRIELRDAEARGDQAHVQKTLQRILDGFDAVQYEGMTHRTNALIARIAQHGLDANRADLHAYLRELSDALEPHPTKSPPSQQERGAECGTMGSVP